jgi:hypothetical protein
MMNDERLAAVFRACGNIMQQYHTEALLRARN